MDGIEVMSSEFGSADCDNETFPPSGTYHSSAAGWIYVVVSEGESPGPRQPVSNWIPPTGLVSYGVVLAVLAATVNAAVCLAALRRRRAGSISGYERDATVTSSSSWRRLAVVNFAVVQLALGVVVVPLKIVTDALGVWSMGGTACRAYLLGQVLLISETMWSVVLIVFDALISTASLPSSLVPASIDMFSSPRYSEFSRRRPLWIGPAAVLVSWLAASTSLLPLGVTLTSGGNAIDGGGTRAPGVNDGVLLEEVCAVSMKKDNAVAQAITAFLLPAAIALTGCIALVCRNFRHLDDNDDLKKKKPETEVEWVSAVAVTVACCATWSPFFALYVALPFCPYDRMCVDPGAWTVLAWFGYATTVVGPVTWALGDSRIRSSLRAAVFGGTPAVSGGQRGVSSPSVGRPVEKKSRQSSSTTKMVNDGCGRSAKTTAVAEPWMMSNEGSSWPIRGGSISGDSSERLVATV